MPSNPDAKLLVTGPSRRGWHRLQLASECLQKYAWTYEAPKKNEVKDPLIMDAGSPALVRGSLWHLAMAHRYSRMQAEQNGENPDVFCEPMEAVTLLCKVNKLPESMLNLIGSAYEVYDYRNPDEIRSKRILEVESLNEIMIKDKYLITGRLDLVYEDLSRQIWVTDHKSSGRITASHKDFYAVSGQMFNYQLMARKKYGDKLAGMKINLVELSGTPKFELISLPRSPFMESQFEQLVEDLEQRIDHMKATGRPYTDWPKASTELVCVTRYGECPFIAKCRFGPEGAKAGNWSWED